MPGIISELPGYVMSCIGSIRLALAGYTRIIFRSTSLPYGGGGAAAPWAKSTARMDSRQLLRKLATGLDRGRGDGCFVGLVAEQEEAVRQMRNACYTTYASSYYVCTSGR